MSAQNLFLAVYLGSKDGAAMQAWNKLDEEERQSRAERGMEAWHGWVDKHRDVIVDLGGPLGKTKTAGPRGIAENVNAMTAYTLVRAASHDEAAALFEDHPHFSLFPGETIDIMPVLPIPGR